MINASPAIKVLKFKMAEKRQNTIPCEYPIEVRVELLSI